MRAGGSHAGIVVRVRQQMDVGSQIRALVELSETHPGGLRNTIVYL